MYFCLQTLLQIFFICKCWYASTVRLHAKEFKSCSLVFACNSQASDINLKMCKLALATEFWRTDKYTHLSLRNPRNHFPALRKNSMSPNFIAVEFKIASWFNCRCNWIVKKHYKPRMHICACMWEGKGEYTFFCWRWIFLVKTGKEVVSN